MPLNFNGDLISGTRVKLTVDNRGFKYGDALFETVKIYHGKVIFWEDHYFRLMASMRMLRMKIPMNFTLENLEEEILKTVLPISNSKVLRARFSIYRKDGGYYMPDSNEVDYLIDVSESIVQRKNVYRIDLFKDFYHYSGLLSTLKTNNKILNILASVYAKDNGLDNCVLLNEKKNITEATNGNIFIVKGYTIKTPRLTEGCLKGILRKKIIEIITVDEDFTVEETAITPFEIQKADEVFITNAIIGIQPVTNYRKKAFATKVSEKLIKSLQLLEAKEKG
ncbi:MAG: aminotransferase class IV [Flavobacteriaceae bacterium]|nr:MAG: aminotransferase class IV [Flavobacteriaceae bacterium]